MLNIQQLNHSLAVRLLRVVFSIYIFITIFMTLMQMNHEYQSEEQAIKGGMLQSQSSFHDILEKALWTFDEEQSEVVLRGMRELIQGVEGVEIIHAEDNSTYRSLGIIKDSLGAIVSTENKEYVASPYLSLFVHEFNIYHDNQVIGKVRLYSSNKQVFDKVKSNFIFILVNAVLKTIALWMLFIWAFNKYLTRPINAFCQTMEQVDIDKQKDEFLKLETFGSVEFSRIEHFFNAMLKRVIETRSKWNELNRTLEEKVVLRTDELEKSNQEQKKYIQLIEKIAVTDEMTQLYNRRYFNDIFPKEIQRAMRDEKSVISFLIFDVDHFKLYNDNYGHKKGDDVLVALGAMLNAECHRASDIAFRLGGEEFGVVFSHSVDESGLEFVEKIRAAVEALNMEHLFNSAADYVTASFGFVSVNVDINNTLEMDDLYKEGDKALYDAKESGRNCVVQRFF